MRREVMYAMLAAIVLIALATFPAVGQKNDQTGKKAEGQGLQQTLMKLQRDEDEAELRRDVTALDRLLLDDVIITGPDGSVTTKANYINQFKNAPADAPASTVPIKYEDVVVHGYGNTAVMNYRIDPVFRDSSTGKDMPMSFRITVVWTKQKDTWRVASTHVSTIPPQNKSS